MIQQEKGTVDAILRKKVAVITLLMSQHLLLQKWLRSEICIAMTNLLNVDYRYTER